MLNRDHKVIRYYHSLINDIVIDGKSIAKGCISKAFIPLSYYNHY